MDVSKETERIEDFIKKQLVASGLDGYVLGMSGGLDSVLVLALACRAVGADKVKTYALPYGMRGTSIMMAALAINKYPVIHTMIPIKDSVDALAQHTNVFGELPMDATRLGNIMARVRMTIIYDMAAANNSMVLNTSNLSEYLMGYTTKYGDNTGDIAPILHLTKTQIRKMARFVGVPKDIIEQAPSAGLVEGQTDEGDLGFTYDELDAVIDSFMKEGDGTTQLFRWMNYGELRMGGITDKKMEKIAARNYKNQHKMVPIHSLLWKE